MSTHESTEEAGPPEALYAIRAGLTPRVVERAVHNKTRHDTAITHGHTLPELSRLANRWGIAK